MNSMFVAGHRNLRERCGLHRLALFGLLLAMLPGTGHSQQDFPDRERYYRAVEFCRGAHVFPGSMLLSPDKLILCFDGVIARDMERVCGERPRGERAVRGPQSRGISWSGDDAFGYCPRPPWNGGGL